MNAPREIVTDASQRVLTLRWDDGREQRLPHTQLRRACACAECRRLRRDGLDVPAAPDISLLAVQLMGYGVQLVFSDGHARGIYPWRYLAQMDAPG